MAPPKKNGFSVFAEELKKTEAKYRHRSLKDMIEIASPFWDALSSEQKSIYNQRAKAMNRDGQKVNSAGTSFDEILRSQQEDHDKNKAIEQEILIFVDSLQKNELLNQKFHLAHVNSYIENKSDEKYIPAEIAIIEFTLADGITSRYHVIFNPGDLMVGYAYEMRLQSERTHKIPADFQDGEPNIGQTFQDIKSFLRKKKKGYYPVYTMPDDKQLNWSMTAVDQAFRAFYRSSAHGPTENEYETLFAVRPLPLLAYALWKKVDSEFHLTGASCVVPSYAMTIQILSRGFSCPLATACEFHEKADAIDYCSLSYCARWIYNILDRCLVLLAPVTEIKPGRHTPPNSADEVAPQIHTVSNTPRQEKKTQPEEKQNEDASQRCEPEAWTRQVYESAPVFKPDEFPSLGGGRNNLRTQEVPQNPVNETNGGANRAYGRGSGKRGRGGQRGGRGRGRGLAADFQNLHL